VSYKSIDLQTSIPRVAEIAPIQHHQQTKSAMEQAMLAGQAVKTAEQQAQRKTKAEPSSHRSISEREPKQGRQRGNDASRQRKSGDGAGSEQPEAPLHPYKGHHIDLSL